MRRGRLDDRGVGVKGENGRVGNRGAAGEKSLGFNVGFLRGIGLVCGTVRRSVDLRSDPSDCVRTNRHN